MHPCLQTFQDDSSDGSGVGVYFELSPSVTTAINAQVCRGSCMRAFFSLLCVCRNVESMCNCPHL